jgi:hypothetical protein
MHYDGRGGSISQSFLFLKEQIKGIIIIYRDLLGV